ncbi:DUF808 domain-containing protein [Weeksellaceae bacterium KMM 9713]|uniref:DUF808 domain-containing protein n=1 Tax=Profundicola chukchiensis TaxID=2961959 RepID=A0A9X4MZI1_9FLAO|nr:DUF808 family protein [Profundicola chukchiensis]MDG4946924.1 DUF808 domain-containing protein [Profundicola chukchiensis]
MASGIFAVLDDIAALMDDVAITSKIAGRKTAAILGDDLAVNAEKATGFVSSRELPVLWAITKGSFVNKLIIVPIALLLNAYYPVTIKYILILGGVYLAYEGAEKIIEYLFHRNKADVAEAPEHLSEMVEDPEAEKKKIKSAVITDFILSIEIIIIALSSVTDSELLIQIITVSVIALVATVGVYGLVALIVRMDDAGYALIRMSKGEGFLTTLGKLLVKALPWIIKSLSVIGTIALILVAGGIFAHNIDFFHDFLTNLPSIVKEALIGLVIGLASVPVINLVMKLFKKKEVQTS